ncbi:MAG: EAL domain-containing protein, partial [Elainellaceae cyanobacterium]
AVLADTGVGGSSLILEITESLLIDDICLAIGLLDQLAAREIRIGIDDFGTGYSSLSYLNQLPVHHLKIDKTFINQMQSEDRHHQIVSAIITLSRQLGLTTIAEGIETDAQFEQLHQLGCEFGQGYLFSKPMTAQEVESRFLRPES